MAKRASQEPDQIALVSRELRDRHWLANARKRSQRRKSAWNLLLPLFGLPLWAGFVGSLLWLGQIIHTAFHPHHIHPLFGWSQPIDASGTLILIPSLVMAVAPAFLVTNFLVYQIAPARRAMEAEDRNFPGVGYKPSQRALLKLGLGLLLICLPLIFIGAVVLR